jgi:Homeodomain-like domain
MNTTTPSPPPSVAELVQLVQTGFPLPFHWQNHLRNLGISAGADLPPTEMAALTERVFRLVKQSSIKDPAGWIASRRAHLNGMRTPMAGVKPATSAEVAGGVSVRKDSVELGVARIEQSVTKTSNPAPPVPAQETSKADVLRRAKAAIDAGESSLREAAEAVALAQKAFNASQREIAEAVGRSASWVNRLLKWHRSGYKECSPFGPTTQAARVAHAQRASAHRVSKRTATKDSTGGGSAETSANATAPGSRKPSAAEAKRNLMNAISQWWPYIDSAGKAEVASFLLRQKADI